MGRLWCRAGQEGRERAQLDSRGLCWEWGEGMTCRHRREERAGRINIPEIEDEFREAAGSRGEWWLIFIGKQHGCALISGFGA